MKNINKSQFTFVGILFLFLVSTSCSTIRLQRAEFAEDKRSNLPQNIKTAEEDGDIYKESACVITVNEDGKTFLIGKEQVAQENLKDKIAEIMENKTPDKRIVYIESPVGVNYATIVSLLNSIRRANVDKAGLLAFRKKYEKLGERLGMIPVRIPDEPNFDDLPVRRPNPLYLVVDIDKSGSLRLNMDSMGDNANTENLTNKLSDIFKERESMGVFREGTNEVEKAIFIKASRSLKYGDVIKLIDAVKLSGAEPISLQVDDLNE